VNQALDVFLIEDSPILRAQLIEILQEIEGINVVGHAEDETTAISNLAAVKSDVAIVDLELKSGSGVGVLVALQRDPGRYHYTTPIVLTTHSNPSIKRTCEQLGARAFFDKAMQMEELIQFVEAARRSTN